MVDVFEVAQLFVDLAHRDYRDDVALVAYYGSYATGSATEVSDLDMYYIPDDGKASSLYRSVLFRGLPFEFWPVSWDFAGRIASGRHHWSVAPSIIVSARVLYSRSQTDLDRFHSLQDQIGELQKPEARSLALRRALEAFPPALFQLNKVQQAVVHSDTTGARLAAIEVIETLLDCLALVNQVFFSKNWASDMEQLDVLTVRPSSLHEHIEAIMTSDDLKILYGSATALVETTRALLTKQQLALADYVSVSSMFSGYYPGIKEYVNKVVSAGTKGDWVAASYAAMTLQRDTAMMLAGVETGVTYSAVNTYGEYADAYHRLDLPDFSAPVRTHDLVALADTARRFDQAVRDYLTGQGVPLNEADSMSQLKRLIKEP